MCDGRSFLPWSRMRNGKATNDVAAEPAAAEKWEMFAEDESGGGGCDGFGRGNRGTAAAYYCLHFAFSLVLDCWKWSWSEEWR